MLGIYLVKKSVNTTGNVALSMAEDGNSCLKKRLKEVVSRLNVLPHPLHL